MAEEGGGGVEDGDGVRSCGLCYHGSDELGEFLEVGVVKVFALHVVFEESVRWESMNLGLGFYKRYLGN